MLSSMLVCELVMFARLRCYEKRKNSWDFSMIWTGSFKYNLQMDINEWRITINQTQMIPINMTQMYSNQKKSKVFLGKN